MQKSDTSRRSTQRVPFKSPIEFIAGRGRQPSSGTGDDTIYDGALGIKDEGKRTNTSVEQAETEALIAKCVAELETIIARESARLTGKPPYLIRERHLQYLIASMKHLPGSFQILDASGPWLCYWMVHAVNILGLDLGPDLKHAFVEFLRRCESPEGGYGGGFMQIPHLATTFGAVNCLLSLGTKEAYDSIDRKSLLGFLRRMHQPDGSYVMHEGGEVDLRGVYCALSVAKSLNILNKELQENTVGFILKCQTYEGGFGGLPGLEAHGGYSYCGIAALAILGAESQCNLKSLLYWMAMRQCPFEGGFNGRTNKLVDGCYSFWLGGAFPIVYRALSRDPLCVSALPVDDWLFNQKALQEYILACCQFHKGGLIDKPGRKPDFYHTCYVLSGLSIAQHFTQSPEGSTYIIGDASNEVEITDALFNVRQDRLNAARLHFLDAGAVD